MLVHVKFYNKYNTTIFFSNLAIGMYLFTYIIFYIKIMLVHLFIHPFNLNPLFLLYPT